MVGWKTILILLCESLRQRNEIPPLDYPGLIPPASPYSLVLDEHNNAMNCEICNGELWVCENHDCISWWHCDCGGAGTPCVCNPEAKLPPDFKVLASVEEHKV